MTKNIISAGIPKIEAIAMTNRLNSMFRKRKLKRLAYVTRVSYSFVKKRTIKGYHVPKINWGVAVKNL